MNAAPDRYRTLAEALRFEPERIKGSRFVADAAPVADPAAAEAVVARVRSEFGDASHHCFAWRVAGAQRGFDDGEPGGSAGAPILRQIEGHDLLGVVVVVTRWFGGTKLGVGGLMRAYGGSAGRALDRARVIEVRAMTTVRVGYPYACSGPIEAVLARHAARVLEAHYGSEVAARVQVPRESLEAFLAALQDASAGRATAESA